MTTRTCSIGKPTIAETPGVAHPLDLTFGVDDRTSILGREFESHHPPNSAFFIRKLNFPMSNRKNTLPHWNDEIFRSRPHICCIRVGVPPTRGSNFWGPRESIFQVRHEEVQLFFKKAYRILLWRVVRFELAILNPCPAVDAICQGISPLGYW